MQVISSLRDWFLARSRSAQIGVGCASLILVCACCGLGLAAANGLTGGSATPTATAGSVLSVQATNTPQATSVPKAPTETPKPKQWTTVQTFSGNGISKTAPFRVTDDQWKITWACDANAYGSSYNLIAELTVPGATFGQGVVNVICTSGNPSTLSGETMEYTQGTFYLDITSEASWTFQI